MHCRGKHSAQARIAAGAGLQKESKDTTTSPKPSVASSGSKDAAEVTDQSEVFTTRELGPASNHNEFLEKVAALYDGQMITTQTNGDCFFDAVQIGLRHLGVEHSISALRQLAGKFLKSNAKDYEPMYKGSADAAAVPYAEYVKNIQHRHEWATEVTIHAMVEGLNRPIRVMSSGTDDLGKPMCWVKQYHENISKTAGREITVMFNAVQAHYLGFIPQDRTPRLAYTPNTASDVQDQHQTPTATPSTSHGSGSQQRTNERKLLSRAYCIFSFL